MTNKFQNIDEFNKVLDGINEGVISYFSDLGDLSNQTESEIQSKIDDMCTRYSNDINTKLSIKREVLVQSLKQAYTYSNELINLLKPLVEIELTDLNSVIKALNLIIGFQKKPYETALQFVVYLTPKLLELTANIDKLANIKNNIVLPDEAKNMNISYDKLNIDIKPITIEEITA